jgi:hypothetical protein
VRKDETSENDEGDKDGGEKIHDGESDGYVTSR